MRHQEEGYYQCSRSRARTVTWATDCYGELFLSFSAIILLFSFRQPIESDITNAKKLYSHSKKTLSFSDTRQWRPSHPWRERFAIEFTRSLYEISSSANLPQLATAEFLCLGTDPSQALSTTQWRDGTMLSSQETSIDHWFRSQTMRQPISDHTSYT